MVSVSMTAAELGRLPAALTVPQAAAVLGIGRSHSGTPAATLLCTAAWPARISPREQAVALVVGNS
jgi:hypothetical protein